MSICGHSDVFSAIWPTSGMTRSGVAYELPTWEPLTGGIESSSSPDGTKGGPNQRGSSGDLMNPKRAGQLDEVATHLLPTPTARDWKGPNQRQDGSCLHGALLPTPAAADGERASLTYVRGNPTLLGAVSTGDSSSPQFDAGKPSLGGQPQSPPFLDGEPGES